jgi:hypothetical protein
VRNPRRAYNARVKEGEAVALLRLRQRLARPGSSRFALTLAVAFVFFVQSFIAQTHIHGTPTMDSGLTIAAFGDPADHPAPFDPFPASVDPVNQVHSGNYASPGFALLVAPAQRIAHVVPVRETRAPDFILSHAWRSRAPPSA